MLKVGLLVGREWSWPPAFIEEVNRRNAGVTAEFVKLGGTAMDEPVPYAVIVDRISHEVPYYRSYLKHAWLQGAAIVNNPFMWTADDKFFGASLITKMGIPSPKTIVLPNREYVPGIKHDESLRNLVYPLDWRAIVDYIGLPCVLKDAHGGGWKDVYICRTLEDIWQNYNTTGQLTMVLQEFIKWEEFIRCVCIGQDNIMPIKYDPGERKYHVSDDFLAPELRDRIVRDSQRICRALGYDMNSIEWAIRDGVPYAIDFMNPAPDMDVNSLTPHYFDWVVKAMADMTIKLAKAPRPMSKRMPFFSQGEDEGEGEGASSPARSASGNSDAKKGTAKKSAAKKTAGKVAGAAAVAAVAAVAVASGTKAKKAQKDASKSPSASPSSSSSSSS